MRLGARDAIRCTRNPDFPLSLHLRFCYVNTLLIDRFRLSGIYTKTPSDRTATRRAMQSHTDHLRPVLTAPVSAVLTAPDSAVPARQNLQRRQAPPGGGFDGTERVGAPSDGRKQGRNSADGCGEDRALLDIHSRNQRHTPSVVYYPQFNAHLASTPHFTTYRI